MLGTSLKRRFDEVSNDATDSSCIRDSLIVFFQGIKMLVAVVVLYAVLWLPMNVFQLSVNLLCYPTAKYQNFCNDQTLMKLLYIAAHFLTVSNTAINPIIYGFANHRFRVGSLSKMFCLYWPFSIHLEWYQTNQASLDQLPKSSTSPFPNKTHWHADCSNSPSGFAGDSNKRESFTSCSQKELQRAIEIIFEPETTITENSLRDIDWSCARQNIKLAYYWEEIEISYLYCHRSHLFALNHCSVFSLR